MRPGPGASQRFDFAELPSERKLPLVIDTLADEPEVAS
jgi:hypothetical protein